MKLIIQLDIGPWLLVNQTAKGGRMLQGQGGSSPVHTLVRGQGIGGEIDGVGGGGEADCVVRVIWYIHLKNIKIVNYGLE